MCKKILLLFRIPFQESGRVNIGTKEHILSLPCKAHSRLFAEVLTDSRYPDFYQSPIQSVWGYKQNGTVLLFGTFLTSKGGARVSEERQPRDSSSVLNLLSSNPRWSHQSTAQIIHPQWIKHGLPRRWKEHCDCHHGAECRRVPLATFLSRGRPKWIIDVWCSCLVPGSLAAEYILHSIELCMGREKFHYNYYGQY